MKRIISLITAVVLLLTVIAGSIPASSAANDELEFILTNAAGNNNEEITIELQIKNNPGIYAFYMMLYYDTDVLILRDCKVDPSLNESGEFSDTKNNQLADDLKDTAPGYMLDLFPAYGVKTEDKSMKLLYFENESIEENWTFNGTALTLTFQIMGIAPAGDYTVGLIPDPDCIFAIEGNDIKDVPFNFTNSIVRVGSTDAPTETAPVVDYKDTEKVETTEVTTQPDINVDTEAPATIETPETFVDEEGTTYYYAENEKGETEKVVYNPEDFTTPESSNESDIPADSDSTGEDGDGSGAINWGKILGFVVAPILALLAIGGILLVFILNSKKSKKEDK